MALNRQYAVIETIKSPRYARGQLAFGAVDEPRSRNLRLGRALLCQLSYYRMNALNGG